MTIYHIVLPETWREFEGKDEYTAESLATEGFIHCSYGVQVDGVLRRYYSGAEKVLVLAIDPSKLISRLVEEPSTNNEVYPHIYGPINRDAVIGVEERELNNVILDRD